MTDPSEKYDLDIPWPKSGDHPIKPIPNPDIAFVLRDTYTAACWLADSYREAADQLVEQWSSQERRSGFEMFPIAYLYRHYLEVSLKNILSLGRQLHSEPKGDDQHHDLMKLWRESRLHLQRIWPDGEPSTLEVIEECVKEFSTVDPRSTSFRYLTNRDGSLSLNGVEALDLVHLREVMARIAGFVNGCLTGMEVYWDQLNDYHY